MASAYSPGGFTGRSGKGARLSRKPVGAIGVQYRVRHRSSVWIWVLDLGRWLGDAGRQLIVGTLLDISSRKEMEQQLLCMAITDP